MYLQVDPIQRRPLHSDEDFWRVRNLLIQTYPMTPLGFNWEVRRWDGSCFYDAGFDWLARLGGRVHLWETTARRLVGVVNAEGQGDAQLQVDPAFRPIEAEMIHWAEAQLATPAADGSRQLEFFVYAYDTPRQQLLTERGYTQTAHSGVIRRLRFADHTLEPAVIAPGYTLRPTNPDDLADCQRIADLLNAAFGRNFHTAREYQNFTQLAPCFRRASDLVAVAPDGSFAAYVGVPYDAVNRHATFEPVCTHPAHRRQGLARTLMLEGLQQAKALGAVDITVETGAMIPANRLYASIGFTEVCTGYIWRKEFAT